MADMKQIATLALQRTKEGRLTWEATASENSFLATLGNQSLRIAYSHEGSGSFYYSTYSLSVFNKDGIEIESTSATGGSEEGKPLGELFEAARRTALNVQEELEEVVKALAS